MAGSLSGHLVDRYNPNNPFNSSVVSHGPMSFNPSMHGTPYAQQSFSFFGNGSEQSFANDSISEDSARKIATLQVKLNQKLGPEFISQRPGPGGGPKLTYVEGWKIINLANEVFGFNGWSSSIVSLTTDFADYNEESRRYSVGVTALMRVTLKDGVFHEDIGYGMLENSRSKGQALDKCKKEAVTDGLKRALRNFGNVLGNCLYDKSYASEIVKVKFEPKKFNQDELHRRPEFEDTKPNISSSSINTPTSTSSMGNNPAPRSGPSNYNTSTSTRPSMQFNQSKPATSLPPHMRSETQAQASVSGKNPATSSNLNPNIRGPAYPQQTNPPQAAQRSSMQPPQQPQQQSMSKPTAAPSALTKMEIDDDDNFGITSQDDALFAMADLGPAIDADIGRPIDHDEGLLRPLNDDDDDNMIQVPVMQKPIEAPIRARSTSTRDPNATRTRQELIAAALASTNDTDGGPDNNNNGSDSSGMQSSRNVPQNHQRANSTVSNSSASTSGSAMSTMRPPPPPQPRSTTTLIQQNHQRYMNNRQQQQQHQTGNQDQNQNPAQLNTSKSLTEDVSPSSIGGFNFPAGMNPLQPGMNGSGIGIKRPADAMNSSTSNSNYRSSRPGMGLQQQSSSSNSTSIPASTSTGRNILGALDITDGGNVKRRKS